MTIYVDEVFTAARIKPEAARFGTQWCHMWTDSDDIEELHRFAAKLFWPVSKDTVRRWFQNHPTLPHYDLVPSKRAQAIELGAVEMTTQERLAQARKKG